jgi:hypothetical protein
LGEKPSRSRRGFPFSENNQDQQRAPGVAGFAPAPIVVDGLGAAVLR